MSMRRIPIAGIDLPTTLRTLTFLRGDPCVQLTPGRLTRATVTPEGTGAVVVEWPHNRVADTDPTGLGGGAEAQVTAFGRGASWLVQHADALIGASDDVSGFDPDAPVLREVWRRHRGDRLVRTGTLWHDLAWFVVQQRITTADAADQWRRLVYELGAPVAGVDHLVAPPDPEVIARMSYPELHRFGIERRRAEHLRGAARAIARHHDLVEHPFREVQHVLASINGVGPWTLGCLATQTWGDADGVILGDDGLPSIIAWLLARELRADDQRMLELLEPYRPHRYRIVRLAYAAGIRPPRRAPRGHRTDIRYR